MPARARRGLYSEVYPVYVRSEGFDEIADRFDSVARSERSHAGRLTSGLGSLS